MKYMGSKNRIAKHILPIMLAERKPDQWWVEPFVGGANTIDKVGGKRLGADMNPYVIDALIAIRDCAADLPRNNQELLNKTISNYEKATNINTKGTRASFFLTVVNGWGDGLEVKTVIMWRKATETR